MVDKSRLVSRPGRIDNPIMVDAKHVHVHTLGVIILLAVVGHILTNLFPNILQNQIILFDVLISQTAI
jgi:hypothetical protein